ncbi:MAG: hypothetical protein AAB268_13705 [Elusimicrobiota bacterium]
MRAIMFAVYVLIVYYAVRAVLRRILQTQQRPTRPCPDESADGEMVLDHECRVYVLKKCAVTRSIRGNVLYFCNDACATAHAAKNRD